MAARAALHVAGQLTVGASRLSAQRLRWNSGSSPRAST